MRARCNKAIGLDLRLHINFIESESFIIQKLFANDRQDFTQAVAKLFFPMRRLQLGKIKYESCLSLSTKTI